MVFVLIDLNLFQWDTNFCLLRSVGFLENFRYKMFFFLQEVSSPVVIHPFKENITLRLHYVQIIFKGLHESLTDEPHNGEGR